MVLTSEQWDEIQRIKERKASRDIRLDELGLDKLTVEKDVDFLLGIFTNTFVPVERKRKSIRT